MKQTGFGIACNPVADRKEVHRYTRQEWFGRENEIRQRESSLFKEGLLKKIPQSLQRNPAKTPDLCIGASGYFFAFKVVFSRILGNEMKGVISGFFPSF